MRAISSAATAIGPEIEALVGETSTGHPPKGVALRRVGWIVLGLVALCASIFAAAAQGDPGAPCAEGDIAGVYQAVGEAIELDLQHECGAEAVRGTLRDPDRYRYEVHGRIEAGELRFTAFRRAPDGDTIVIFSNGLDIASGGRSLHGQLERTGAGVPGAMPITFARKGEPTPRG